MVSRKLRVVEHLKRAHPLRKHHNEALTWLTDIPESC